MDANKTTTNSTVRNAVRVTALATLIIVGLGVSSAHAQDVRIDAEPEADSGHGVSVTLSPIHLAGPFVELQGEVRLSDSVGVSAIAGMGSLPLEMSAGDTERIFVLELGAQARWYPVGDFDHGMQLGLELMNISVFAESTDLAAAAGAEGLAFGPFVGYKWTAEFGLTLEVQGGVQGILAQSDEPNAEITTDWAPLLNLNLGWSF